MIKKLLFFILIILFSCKKETPLSIYNNPQDYYIEKDSITPDDRKEIDEKEAKTYYVNPKYRYKYRTGISDHYEYNYDIVGYNSDSSIVRGNINIRGNQGAGMIIDKQGNEKDIYVYWVENKKLIGKDKEGNQYEFEVE